MCDMMSGMGAWMAVWAVLGFLVLGLAVTGAVWLVRSLTSTQPRRTQLTPPEDSAYADLRRRYAAGEIGREEFLQRKVDLEP